MAQSDLIILTFDRFEAAQYARRALGMMREEQAFGLEYASEITRAGDGTTTLHQQIALPAYPHPGHTRLPGLLSAAIFTPVSQEHRHRLTELGLDEFFLQRVTQALTPNSSALLIFVPADDDLVNLRALLNAVALLKCTLHRTSIPEGIEQTLLRYFTVL